MARRQRVRSLSLALLVAAVAAEARAAEFVLVDGNTLHDTKSHEFLRPLAGTTPTNWQSPVDYGGGRAYFYVNVVAKPAATIENVAFCFNNSTGAYTCSQPRRFSATGPMAWSQSLPSFWAYGRMDWRLPVRQVSVIIRDRFNVKIDAGEKFEGAPSMAAHFPLSMQVKIVIVSAGQRISDGGVTNADAGRRDAGADASRDTTPKTDLADAMRAPTVDADEGGATPADAGGSAGGRGGRGGSGAPGRDGGGGGTGGETEPEEELVTAPSGCSLGGAPTPGALLCLVAVGIFNSLRGAKKRRRRR